LISSMGNEASALHHGGPAVSRFEAELAWCRKCSNTGVDLKLGTPCSCAYGKSKEKQSQQSSAKVLPKLPLEKVKEMTSVPDLVPEPMEARQTRAADDAAFTVETVSTRHEDESHGSSYDRDDESSSDDDVTSEGKAIPLEDFAEVLSSDLQEDISERCRIAENRAAAYAKRVQELEAYLRQYVSEAEDLEKRRSHEANKTALEDAAIHIDLSERVQMLEAALARQAKSTESSRAELGKTSDRLSQVEQMLRQERLVAGQFAAQAKSADERVHELEKRLLQAQQTSELACRALRQQHEKETSVGAKSVEANNDSGSASRASEAVLAARVVELEQALGQQRMTHDKELASMALQFEEASSKAQQNNEALQSSIAIRDEAVALSLRLRAQLQKAESDKAELEDKAASAKMVEEKESALTRVAALEEELERSKMECSVANATIKTVTAMANRASELERLLQQQVETAGETKAKSDKDLEEALAQARKLQEQLQDQQEALQKAEERTKELERSLPVQAMSQRVSDLEAALHEQTQARIEAEIAAERKLQATLSHVADLEKDLLNRSSQAEASQEEATQSAARIHDLEEKLKEKTKQVEHIKVAAEVKTRTIGELEAQLKEKDVRLLDLKDELGHWVKSSPRRVYREGSTPRPIHWDAGLKSAESSLPDGPISTCSSENDLATKQSWRQRLNRRIVNIQQPSNHLGGSLTSSIAELDRMATQSPLPMRSPPIGSTSAQDLRSARQLPMNVAITQEVRSPRAPVEVPASRSTVDVRSPRLGTEMASASQAPPLTVRRSSQSQSLTIPRSVSQVGLTAIASSPSAGESIQTTSLAQQVAQGPTVVRESSPLTRLPRSASYLIAGRSTSNDVMTAPVPRISPAMQTPIRPGKRAAAATQVNLSARTTRVAGVSSTA